MTLLTGANGYIGKALRRHLAQQGLAVTGLYHGERVAPAPGRLECDLSRTRHLETLAKRAERYNTVIHLAGMVSVALAPDPQNPAAPPRPVRIQMGALYRANVLATANLVDYCLTTGVRHLVFASTQGVYGMPPTQTVTERSPLAPLEHYAASKVACEEMLRVASRQGLGATVLRFPGIYGGERTSGVVARFCADAHKDKRIVVTQRYPLPFDVLHLDDLLAAFAAVLAHPSPDWRVYNIATGEPCSLDLLADDVAALVPGTTVKYAPVPQPVIRLDATAAARDLGWRAVPRQERLAQVLEEVRGGTQIKISAPD